MSCIIINRKEPMQFKTEASQNQTKSFSSFSLSLDLLPHFILMYAGVHKLWKVVSKKEIVHIEINQYVFRLAHRHSLLSR